MTMPKYRLSCLLMLTLWLGACTPAEEGPSLKPTAPVFGQILVDGSPPGSPIQVTCLSQSGIDQENPTFSQCLSDNDGKFEISTYEKGDGVPAGDYVLTFMWGQVNLVKMGYGGPDKFKGRYSDPEKSEFVVSVVEGLPTDLGVIELTTTPPAK